MSLRPLPGGARVNLRRPVRVGAWNVRTLRRTGSDVQLAGELARLRISVAALSEVRWPGTGSTSAGGYTFYWSGRPDGWRTGGVAIAVAGHLLPAVDIGSIRPISERLMSLRLRHTMGTLTVISVYAPTDQADGQDKDLFYLQLSSVVEGCKAGEIPLLLGDFNARVGSERAGYEDVVGPHTGSLCGGARTENGSRLLDFARGHSLRIAGTWFQRPDEHRWTWYSNTGTFAAEIDHVLVRSRWRLLRNCRVFRGAEFDTDHRLLVAELQIRLRPRRPSSRSPALNIAGLRDEDKVMELRSRYESVAGSDGSRGDPATWESFRDRLTSAAHGVLGVAVPEKRRNPLPPEAIALIGRRRSARLNGDKATYRSLRKPVIRVLREAEENRVREVCECVSSHLFTSGSGPAFRAIKTLSGKHLPRPPSCVLSKDGNPLDGPKALARVAGYFEELLEADPPPTAVDWAGAVPIAPDPAIDTRPPHRKEVERALAQMKSGRAAGICGIPAELLSAGGDAVLRDLVAVFHNIWNTSEIPSDWRRSLIVPIFKRKGDPRDCNNYRGISLLSVPGKVFSRVILNRIRGHLVQHQRPEQSGFTPKKSTVDRILALRVLIERRREFRKPFLGAYVDFKKAFDSVHRETLWELLRLRGIPEKILCLIRALYTDTESAVRWGGGTSEFFHVSTGVRQGCVLAPSLFSACMDWIMGSTVGHGFSGASLGDERFTDLDFADDAVIFAETMQELTGFLDALSGESGRLGLRISWMKTKIQQFIHTVDQACSVVSCGDEEVEVVSVFPYLGSRISDDGSVTVEIEHRLGLAWGAMSSLGGRIWCSKYLSRGTKAEVFKRLVLPVLLYGCETWTLTATMRARLDSFGTKNLRRIFGYRWYDKVSNQRLLEEASLDNISTIVLRRQLSMFGHVARLPAVDPAHRVLSCGNPPSWRRGRGRPQLTWLRQLDQVLREKETDRPSAWAIAKCSPEQYRALGRSSAKRPRGCMPP